MVWQNDVGPVAYEQVAIDLDARGAKRIHFFHEGKRIQHDTIADHAAASLAQDAAGNQLQNKLLALDGDGVAGIVAARIARYDLEALGENVNDLTFSLIAPLCADNNRRLSSFQLATPVRDATGRRWLTCRVIQIRTQLAGDFVSIAGCWDIRNQTGRVTLDFTGRPARAQRSTPSAGSGVLLPYTSRLCPNYPRSKP